MIDECVLNYIYTTANIYNYIESSNNNFGSMIKEPNNKFMKQPNIFKKDFDKLNDNNCQIYLENICDIEICDEKTKTKKNTKIIIFLFININQ